MDSFDINVIVPGDDSGCSCCEFGGYKTPFYRRNILGTPFYISNTIPLLLEACEEAGNANELPSRGKRLITFTDSRQGTARISAKIQQDSERESIRGTIYEKASQNIVLICQDELEADRKKLSDHKEKIIKFNAMGEDALAKDIEELVINLSRKLSSAGTVKSVDWNEAVTFLQTSRDISNWIFDYYKNIELDLFSDGGSGIRNLTEMLLMREFARRPKRKNSMETLGLVSVQYPALKQVKIMPQDWEKQGANLQDWHDFLKVILDFYIRENTIIDIPREWTNWMGAKVYPKSVIRQDSEESTSPRIRRWPQVIRGRNNRLIRMLALAFDLDIEKIADKDLINGILKSAWTALTSRYSIRNEQKGLTEEHRILTPVPGSGVEFHLARSEIAFQACTEAWVCPQTHRLIDSTFKGITPYLPFKFQKDQVRCEKVSIPVCQLDVSGFRSNEERKAAIRNWGAQQLDIARLRNENLWTDISDKIIEGGKFIRTAEHSAQQPSSILEKYEELFKAGKINVLNCSTTMEMGVDIGGISVVAMNNVPPHPANYLQRAGRAGRRGETQALAFTICKDNPHERSVFAKPLWPFETSIKAPYITLNSQQIVQRHINSLFLATFLKQVLTGDEREILNLPCDWFFVADQDQSAPVEKMTRWLTAFLHGEQLPDKLADGIKAIIRKSILSHVNPLRIIQQTLDALNSAKDQWLPAYQKLQNEFMKLQKVNKTDPYRRKVENDLKCLGEQYLLSELASHAFLPGYGFPTGIATFDHYSVSDYKRGKYVTKNGRIDNRMRLRERPGRDLPIAIREYAPGSDIVLNGLVYRSAGILVNKFSPDENYSEPQRLTIEWRCHSCGWISNEPGSSFEQVCSGCGTRLLKDNIKEYMEPAGFAVEFYSSPTNNISSQAYIPVQEPWVTAGSDVQPLFEPVLGSYKASPQGHIFHHSSGINGTGFTVCLRCGKAESTTVEGDYPPDLQPGKMHRKLQGKPGSESSAFCEGADEAYAIKNGIHFGATDQTDIFELYLKYPSENKYLKHQKQDQLPWTLAVALRQALADIHGINADEIGFTVKATTLPDCNYPVAGIVLFDKAGGGAGFSSAAPRHIRDMLERAYQFLHCRDNCESACQSCLLGYDTRFHVDLLDRSVALNYLQGILLYLRVPDEAKFFGDKSMYCFESLGAEILSTARGQSRLKIFTGSPYSAWDISNSQVKEACLSWKSFFDVVELVLPSKDITDLDDIQKEDLKALHTMGVQLTVLEGDLPPFSMQGNLLVQIINETETVSFASNALDVNLPNYLWWQIGSNYLIKTTSLGIISASELDRNLLVTEKVQGDVEIEVFGECDAKLFMFGKKLWEVLAEKSDSLNKAFKNNAALNAVSYTDCYICSPWSLMLFAEVITSLKIILREKYISPTLKLVTAEKNANPKARSFYAEWNTSAEKSQVIGEYFRAQGQKIDVAVKPMKQVPHGRVLELEWSDNSKSLIRFDHGFGCWNIGQGTVRKWFDIDSSIEAQIKNMQEARKSLDVEFSKDFSTQIFIKAR